MKYKEINLTDVKTFLSDAYPNKFVDVNGLASTKEYVFDFAINPDIVVRVFSSIHKDTAVARRKGSDAIRVCAVNLTLNRGWISTTRVFRVEGWQHNLHRAINKTITEATNRCVEHKRVLSSSISLRSFSNNVVINVRKGMYHKNNLSHKSSKGYFVLEASDVDLWPGHPGQKVVLNNPETNNQLTFKFVRADVSNEDTCGWNYISDDNQYELLIIND